MRFASICHGWLFYILKGKYTQTVTSELENRQHAQVKINDTLSYLERNS